VATFYLIRHGEVAATPGVLYGRTPGIHLSEYGRHQARTMAQRFHDIPVRAIYSSPLERAIETAEPLSESLSLPVTIHEGFSEVDYGEWSGRVFSELENDPQWLFYKTDRTKAQIPGGENILSLQERFVKSMAQVQREHPLDNIVVVSHQDPIKTAVAYFLGLHLNMFLNFEIGHTSISVIRQDDNSARVLTLNNVGRLKFS